MKDQAAGLYLLQDGTHADPKDCSAGKDGVLRHKNGLAVALDQNGEPQTVGRDAERNKNVEAAKVGEDAAAKQAPAGATALAAKPAPDIMKTGDMKPFIPARETKAD